MNPEDISEIATRKTIENIDIHCVVEGKIVEEWGVSDPSPFWQRRMCFWAVVAFFIGAKERCSNNCLPRLYPQR
jgi:hypothetical protein